MTNKTELRKMFENLWLKSNGHFRYFQFSDEHEKYVSTGEKGSLTEQELIAAQITLNTAYLFFIGGFKTAKPVPEWAVIVPKLSANYLFNKVPELGFKSKDEKETVLYHLNYMASEFNDSAKQFVKKDHEKQEEFLKVNGGSVA